MAGRDRYNYPIPLTIHNILTHFENNIMKVLHLEFESHLQLKCPLTECSKASDKYLPCLGTIFVSKFFKIYFQRIVNNGHRQRKFLLGFVNNSYLTITI